MLFPGTAFAVALLGLAVGYQAPGSLRTLLTKIEPASDIARASTDPASAVASTSALRRDNVRVEGFAKIGFAEMEELLTTTSPQQRDEWARELGELPQTPLKPIALTAFYTAWLDSKPEEAFRSLRNFPDLLNRLSVLDALHGAIPATLLPQLIDVVSELSAVERRALLPSYLALLAETDPAATARFIDSHPKLVSVSDATTLVSAWAQDDVDAARKWLEGSQFSTEPEVVALLVQSWWAKDPAAAQNYVVLHANAEGIDQAANSIALELFNTSPEQTLQFLTRFEDRRASRILMNLAMSVNNEQIANLVAWASALPSSVTEESLGYALARWTSLDSKPALDWLRAKSVSERESLFLQMIRSEEAPVSPEVVALAFKIRDAPKRDEALSILVRSLGTEGDATEEIRALGLSASQTKRLLELRAASSE